MPSSGHAPIAQTKPALPKHEVVYASERLTVVKIAEHTYMHTSFLSTQSFGKVACNGMLVVQAGTGIIFDTPTDPESSNELLALAAEKLQIKVKAVVATHFHEDCVGGLQAFLDAQIPSYASRATVELLMQQGEKSNMPQTSFEGRLTLPLGKEKVEARFLGEGHTTDNIIGYFPKDRVLFGGCLIKEIGANKGNLADANVQAWPETVSKVKQHYPKARVVIPGHGQPGGTELLDYTIQLFR
nr:subclass B1 metallo-beta-lactamase [Rufibacter sp. SYSU D00308]